MVTIYSLFAEIKDAMEHIQRLFYAMKQGRPRLLRTIDELFLVLMRLRVGLVLQCIADRFHISKSTCSHITNTWISHFSEKFSFPTSWPTKATNSKNNPKQIQINIPTTNSPWTVMIFSLKHHSRQHISH